MKTQRILWAVAAALLASCAGYGAPDEVVFGEAVYTQPARNADFVPLTTYYLDPAIKVVEDDTSESASMPTPLAAAIDANLQGYGYTTAAQADADVRVKVYALKGSGAVYYPGYWCDYWVYYGCYYDWYYAGSYKFGTLILEMADIRQPVANQPLPILWAGAVYGVATSQAYDTQRILDGVGRAFDQSPYLDTHDAQAQ